MLALSQYLFHVFLLSPLEVSDDKSGGCKYQDTGEQFSLYEYIPDSPRKMSQLSSCIVACVLQCQCQWIINYDKLSCSSTPSSTPQKKPTLCELVAVDVRPANVLQEILLKIDTNTVKINLNVTFTKEMPTQYHTGCHWQLSRKCKRQN